MTMSNSRKNAPVSSITTARSEKDYKRTENRAQRRRSRQVLAESDELSDLPHGRQYGNPWCGPKDGKLRFDPKAFPEAMRK